MPVKMVMNYIDADNTQFAYNSDIGVIYNEDNDDGVIALPTELDCDELILFIQWIKSQISE
jgi:hypothetical protein